MYWTNERARSLLAAIGFSLTVLAQTMLASSAVGQENVAPDGSLSAEPYVVFVAQDEAFARCGPSGDFYRTDSLRHGQELEVYVETADGWLGIRPPEESFCWIPASSLELSGSNDRATVIEDHTVAWIGTHLGRARRYRWQVQLAEGEPVTILGKSERDGPDGPQMWYRIVPPSGEFRWIHRDQIVESPEELVAKAVADRADKNTIEFLPSPSQQRPRDREQLAREVAEPDDVQERETIAENRIDQNGSSRRPNRKSITFGSFGKADAIQPTDKIRGQESDELRQAESNDRPIGSGVREEWQTNATRGRAIDEIAANTNSAGTFNSRIPKPPADEYESTRNNTPSSSSLSFRGSPRLQSIGSSYESMTPASTELASDSNWVGSGIRSASSHALATDTNSSGANARGAIRQAAAFSDPVPMVQQTLHIVSAESVASVESESRGADADKLQLMLSRVMAGGGSAHEAEPIARAAEQLARSTPDQLEARRAEAVVDRTRQYQRVAQRRDGDSVLRSSAPPMIPVSSRFSVSSSIPPINPPPLAGIGASDNSSRNVPMAAGDWVSETGFLVQVYSARPNSPPFALTDRGGRTIAYVTPAPGTNVRMHLNNFVRVEGPRGFVNGMDTPHILANQAQRAAE